MKMTTKLAAGLLLLAIALLYALPVAAQGLHGGSPDGKVIFGDDFVLNSGETLHGDLVVFGGNVTLESGSTVAGSLAVIGGNVEAEKGVTVSGDLALIGGNLSMDGKLDGDAVLVGGNLALGNTAIVAGDIHTVGGTILRAPNAQVAGDIVDNSTAPSITIPEMPSVNVPDVPPAVISPDAPQPKINTNFQPFSGLLGTIGWAIAVALTAVIASLFLHPQMDRVTAAIAAQPVITGSFGLLGIVAAILAIVMMSITIILIPVSALAILGLLLAWLFGLASIGQEVGDRLGRHLNQPWSVPLSAGIGTLLLMLVVGLVGTMIPCVGALAGFLIGLAGFGGVILTYFGSRNYPMHEIVPLEVPPAS